MFTHCMHALATPLTYIGNDSVLHRATRSTHTISSNCKQSVHALLKSNQQPSMNLKNASNIDSYISLLSIPLCGELELKMVTLDHEPVA